MVYFLNLLMMKMKKDILVEEGILIRENNEEWREPLVEVDECKDYLEYDKAYKDYLECEKAYNDGV